MEAITVYVSDNQKIQLFINLAKMLNLKIDRFTVKKSIDEKEIDNTALFNKLRTIQEQPNFTSNFGNPIEWQKETRKDRKLPFRD